MQSFFRGQESCDPSWNTDQGVQLLSKLKVLLKTLQRSKSDFVVFCAKVANPNHPHTHCNIISSDE